MLVCPFHPFMATRMLLHHVGDNILPTLIEKDHLGVRSPEKGLRTPYTQMIFFNQGMLLLGSNHFLINILPVCHGQCRVNQETKTKM